MNEIKKHRGFTFIELTIVIVLIAVLAAVALPRFANLQNEATIKVIKQTEGAMRSASALYRAKAFVKGVENGQLTGEVGTYQILSGYLKGNWDDTWRQVFDLGNDIGTSSIANECIVNELCGTGNIPSAPTSYPNIAALGLRSSANGVVFVWPKGYFVSDNCFAYYNNPMDGDEPEIGSVTSGC